MYSSVRCSIRDGADRLGAQRRDARRRQCSRARRRAFLPQRVGWDPTPSSSFPRLVGHRASETLHVQVRRVTVDQEKTTPSRRANCRCAGGNDELSAHGAATTTALAPFEARSYRPGVRAVVATACRSWRACGFERAPAPKGLPDMRPSRSSRRLRIRRETDQAAGEHHRLEIGLDHEPAAERLHDDHGVDRSAAKPACLLGERRGEQAEIGEFLPVRLAPTRLARNDLAALCRNRSSPRSIARRCPAGCFCSSVNSKSIAGFLSLSQTQHRLGDDVALDFVGAAVDRSLAHVEVVSGCGVRVVRPGTNSLPPSARSLAGLARSGRSLRASAR